VSKTSCSIKHCKKEYVLTYLGKRLCDSHWGEHCTRTEKRVKVIEIEKKETQTILAVPEVQH
jgi:hypothetical protein